MFSCPCFNQQKFIHTIHHVISATHKTLPEYAHFEKDGSNINHAKKYHNVIAPSIIKTEINGHIATALLHCLLGIVKKAIDIAPTRTFSGAEFERMEKLKNIE